MSVFVFSWKLSTRLFHNELAQTYRSGVLMRKRIINKMHGCAPVVLFSTNTKEKWDLVSAVCLERNPIITREPNEIERRYLEMQTKVEFENSMKSDHEVRHENDMRRKNASATEEDLDLSSQQTAQDFEDAVQEELSNFNFSSRVTEADRKNDVRSLERKLDRYLLLVVNQKLGSDHHWVLPQGVREDGETLRQTAERVLKEACGVNVNAKFHGNAPWGFYKYKYPSNVRNGSEGSVGAKIFFFKAQHVSGQLEAGDYINDYCWLVRDELQQKLPTAYCESVSKFLVDEC